MNRSKHRKESVSGRGSASRDSSNYNGNTGSSGTVHQQMNNSNNGLCGTKSMSRSRTPDSSEEEDFSFPILKAVDRAKNLRCYSAVLSRIGDEAAISMEDVDRLQGELETLLSSAAVRRRTLQAELAALTNGTSSTVFSLVSAVEPKKRKLSDGRSSKSMKDLSKIKDIIKSEGSVHSSENETDNSTELPLSTGYTDIAAGIVSNQVVAAPVAAGLSGSQNDHLSEPESAPPPPPGENDIPDKFWASVEPYCAEISSESIRTIEDMIGSCCDDIEGIKIPPLGEHYTVKWAQEEISDERDATSVAASTGGVTASTKRGGGGSTVSSNHQHMEIKNVLKQTNVNSRDRCTGPFTQRLVSALMEENLTSPIPPDNYGNYKFDEDYMSKLPMYHTTACFEKRLRKELEVLGLVDPKEDETDQIYEELTRCDEELKAVAKRNKTYFEKILAMAEKEMKRQAIRTKIRALDQEILEVYKRVNAAKLVRKQLKKKDKVLAWTVLKEREALYKSLEEM